MGNGKHRKEMNDNRAEVYRGQPLKVPVIK